VRSVRASQAGLVVLAALVMLAALVVMAAPAVMAAPVMAAPADVQALVQGLGPGLLWLIPAVVLAPIPGTWRSPRSWGRRTR
jgi:hypothetical protein